MVFQAEMLRDESLPCQSLG